MGLYDVLFDAFVVILRPERTLTSAYVRRWQLDVLF